MNQAQSYCRSIKRMCNRSGSGVDPNIVLLLPFNGNVKDYSVNGYTPTIHGLPTFVTGYLAGTQAYNTSNGNYLEYLDLPNLADTFSVDFFIKATGGRAVKTGSFSISISTYAQFGGVFVSNYTDVDAGAQLIGKAFTLNTWYHTALTRDENNTLRFFVNGTMAGSATSDWRAGTRVSIDSGASFETDRNAYVSNYRLTTDVLHNVNNGVYTFPTPTRLYV